MLCQMHLFQEKISSSLSSETNNNIDITKDKYLGLCLRDYERKNEFTGREINFFFW